MVRRMTERSIFANLVRQADGAVSATYGPFLLQSALQPIFSEREDGVLRIEAFEGLIRASRDGIPCPPADFFDLVPEEERAVVDSLCRSLHILNTGALGRRDATLIANFHPGLFMTQQAIRQEVERLRLAAHEANLPPERIACEIRAHPQHEPEVPARFAARLHAAGFKVAIDDYSGDDRDLERLQRLHPDFVTFNGSWLRSFAGHSAGLALIRVVLGQFARAGIRAIMSGVEEPEQIELCRAVGMPLMQGYLLARPELAPTTFNLRFPDREEDVPALAETRVARAPRHFGKRGA